MLCKIRGTKTGFFHVEQLDGRWWFIDPDGVAFFAVGLNRVYYHNTKDSAGREPYFDNVSRRFGSEEAWAKHTEKRIKDWGFNTASRNLRDMVHTGWCSASHTFGEKTKLLKAPGVPGYMTFVDIFDPAWAENYAEVCRTTAAPQKNDRRLLGWYTDNELFWGSGWYAGRSLLDAVLFQSEETFNKRALVRFLRDKYAGDLRAFNATWQTRLSRWDGLLGVTELRAFNDGIWADKRAFLFHYARHYFKTVNTLLKQADPNHLNLGSRTHGWWEPDMAAAMGEFVDVISYNKYDGIAPTYQMEELLTKPTGRPVLLSEWGFRAADAGMLNTGGVGRIVKDQKTRGQRYGGFLEGLARSPACVGSIFYAYVDDPPFGGGGMMKNENSNYGLVDIKDKPYAACVREVAKANKRAAAQHAQGREPSDTIVIATPRDYFREPVERFFIQRTGRVINNEHLRAYLRGDQESQPAIFDVDFARPVKFIAAVYEVLGDAVLEFVLDGKKSTKFKLPAGPKKGNVQLLLPDGWHSMYDKECGVTIPAGPHTLTVRNAGGGWVWVDGYRVR